MRISQRRVRTQRGAAAQYIYYCIVVQYKYRRILLVFTYLLFSWAESELNLYAYSIYTSYTVLARSSENAVWCTLEWILHSIRTHCTTYCTCALAYLIWLRSHSLYTVVNVKGRWIVRVQPVGAALASCRSQRRSWEDGHGRGCMRGPRMPGE